MINFYICLCICITVVILGIIVLIYFVIENRNCYLPLGRIYEEIRRLQLQCNNLYKMIVELKEDKDLD